MLDARWRGAACKKIPMTRSIVATRRNRSSTGACSRYCVQRAPEANADDPVLAKKHMTAKRTYVLAAEEDAWEDEMNALFEFLTTEPAICPTA